MAKATFPYKVTNNMDKYVRLKQAKMTKEKGRKVTLQEVYEEAGKHCYVRPATVSMIKSGSYNPSITLAFLLAEFFESTVDEMFSIEPLGSEEK